MRPSNLNFAICLAPACGGESRTHVGWRGGSAHHDGRGIRTEILRKKLEHGAAKLINWIGNRSGDRIYMFIQAKKHV